MHVEDRIAYQGFFLIAAMEAALIISGVGGGLERRQLGTNLCVLFIVVSFHALPGIVFWEKARRGIAIRNHSMISMWRLPPPALLATMATAALVAVIFLAPRHWNDAHLPLWFRSVLLIACNGFGMMVLVWMRTFVEFVQHRRTADRGG